METWQVTGLRIDLELRLVTKYPIEKLDCLGGMLCGGWNCENVPAGKGRATTLVLPAGCDTEPLQGDAIKPVLHAYRTMRTEGNS